MGVFNGIAFCCDTGAKRAFAMGQVPAGVGMISLCRFMAGMVEQQRCRAESMWRKMEGAQ
jgi:hypothetical protein